MVISIKLLTVKKINIKYFLMTAPHRGFFSAMLHTINYKG